MGGDEYDAGTASRQHINSETEPDDTTREPETIQFVRGRAWTGNRRREEDGPVLPGAPGALVQPPANVDYDRQTS